MGEGKNGKNNTNEECLKDEVHRLKCELDVVIEMRNGQEMRGNGMERDLRCELEGNWGLREMQIVGSRGR